MKMVYLTIARPVDIPMQIAKWLAICEMFPRLTRLGLGHEAQHACYPTDLQILEDGRLRVLFAVYWEEDLQRINFGSVPYIGVYTDRLGHAALATRPVPNWVIWPRNDWVGQMPMLSTITSAKHLAEILLAILEDLHVTGAKDRGALRDVFDQSVRWVQRGSRLRLSDGQLASILELADQCRPRLASPPPALPVDNFPGLDASSSSRSGSPSEDGRRAGPAKPPVSKLHQEDLVKLYEVRYLPPGPDSVPWLKGKTPFDIRRQAAALSA